MNLRSAIPAATAPVAAAVIFSALAGGALVANASVVRSAHAPMAARGSWISPQAKIQPILYVVDYSSNTVNIYPQKGKNQTMIGQLTGFDAPGGVYVNGRGDLYVANSAGGNVPVYHRGGTTPFEVLNSGTEVPYDVAEDGNGTVYVANLRNGVSGAGDVSVYANGGTSPTSMLTDPNWFNVVGITTDARNNVYVCADTSGGTYGVDEFKAKSTAPINLGLNLSSCQGIRMDPVQRLINPDPLSPGVELFPSHHRAPSTVFGRTQFPLFVALTKSATDVYVSEYTNDVINEYTYPGGVLVNTITNNLVGYILGVATDPPAKN